MMESLRKLVSYFWENKKQDIDSDLHPELYTQLQFGKRVLNSGNVNFSGGMLYKSFKKTIRKYQSSIEGCSSILLLGLGLGSVPEILKKHTASTAHVTSVEVDQKIIDLFLEENIPLARNVEVIEADALEFIFNESSKYDICIVDLFVGLDVPTQFMTKEFLHRLKVIAPKLIFNFIVYDLKSLSAFESLVSTLLDISYHVEEYRPYSGNRMLYVEFHQEKEAELCDAI